MKINQQLITDFNKVLDESINYVTDKACSNYLLKNKNISLYEAELINKLTKEVILESSDMFLPSSEELRDADGNYSVEGVENPTYDIYGDLMLQDKEGNQYIYHADNRTLEKIETEPKSDGSVNQIFTEESTSLLSNIIHNKD